MLLEVAYSDVLETNANGILDPFEENTSIAWLSESRTAWLGGAMMLPRLAVPATTKSAIKAVIPAQRTKRLPLDAPVSFPDVSILNFLATDLLFCL